MSDCLKEIEFNAQNLTPEMWENFAKQHSKDIYFRRAVLKSDYAPKEMLESLCRNEYLFGDCNILALKSKVVSCETKMNCIIPNMSPDDINRFILTTLQSRKDNPCCYIDMSLIDAIIDNDSLNDNVRINAYSLMDTTSDVYNFIRDKQFDKLYPQERINDILSLIVNNEKLPTEDRVSAYYEGCEPELLETPPQSLIPEILKQVFNTFEFDNGTDADNIAINIIRTLLDNGINNQVGLRMIVDQCPDYIFSAEPNIVVNLAEQVEDTILLNKVLNKSDDPKVIFAAIQNPCFDHKYLNDKIIQRVNDLDNCRDKNFNLKVISELIRRSTLTDKQYDILLKSKYSETLSEYIMQSYYTPNHIVKKICDKNLDFFVVPYKLNENKSCFFPSIYYAIMSFLFNRPIPPLVDVSKTCTNSVLNLKKCYDIMECSEKNNHFSTAYHNTIVNAYCYNDATTVLKNIISNYEASVPFREKLKYVLHNFENMHDIYNLCTRSLISHYFNMDYNLEITLDYKNLYRAGTEEIEDTLSKVCVDFVDFFHQKLRESALCFDSQELMTLRGFNESIEKCTETVMNEKQKDKINEEKSKNKNKQNIDDNLENEH